MIVQSDLLKIKKKITTFYLMSRLQRCVCPMLLLLSSVKYNIITIAPNRKISGKIIFYVLIRNIIHEGREQCGVVVFLLL